MGHKTKPKVVCSECGKELFPRPVESNIETTFVSYDECTEHPSVRVRFTNTVGIIIQPGMFLKEPGDEFRLSAWEKQE